MSEAKIPTFKSAGKGVPKFKDVTVPELKALLKERGVKLKAGYTRKAELYQLLCEKAGVECKLDEKSEKKSKTEGKEKKEKPKSEKTLKGDSLKKKLRIPYFTDFFPRELVEAAVKWVVENKKLFGQPEIPTPGGKKKIPRLQLLMGKDGQTYTYSRTKIVAVGWSKPIKDLLDCITLKTGKTANGVLINIYMDGKHWVDWHSDSESDLAEKSDIIGVSFGASRRLSFRDIEDHSSVVNYDLVDNSLYVMEWPTNHISQHTLRKTSKPVGMRINLTFRTFKDLE